MSVQRIAAYTDTNKRRFGVAVRRGRTMGPITGEEDPDCSSCVGKAHFFTDSTVSRFGVKARRMRYRDINGNIVVCRAYTDGTNPVGARRWRTGSSFLTCGGANTTFVFPRFIHIRYPSTVGITHEGNPVWNGSYRPAWFAINDPQCSGRAPRTTNTLDILAPRIAGSCLNIGGGVLGFRYWNEAGAHIFQINYDPNSGMATAFTSQFDTFVTGSLPNHSCAITWHAAIAFEGSYRPTVATDGTVNLAFSDLLLAPFSRVFTPNIDDVAIVNVSGGPVQPEPDMIAYMNGCNCAVRLFVPGTPVYYYY